MHKATGAKAVRWDEFCGIKRQGEETEWAGQDGWLS